MGIVSINNGARVGAAAFVLGLSLAGPHAAVASADGRDSDSSMVSAGPAAGDSSRGQAPGHRNTNRSTRSAAAERPTRSGTEGETPHPNRHSAVKPAAAAPSATPKPSAATGTDDAVTASTQPTPLRIAAPATRGAAGIPRQAVDGPGQGVRPASATTPPASVAPCATCGTVTPARPLTAQASAIAAVGTKIDQLFDRVSALLSSLPANGITEFLSGTLLLVRRSLFNNAPTAHPAQLTQTSDDTVTGTLGAVDPEGDKVIYKLLTQPANGTVSIDPATGKYVYTPKTFASYGETDQFTVQLADTGPHLHLLRAAAAPEVTVAVNVAPSATLIQFPELDSLTSPLAVRVDKSQVAADGIKVDAGTTFTLTLPGPTSSYTWLANKNLVDITPGADNTLTVKANQAGFLGLSIKAKSGDAARYVGVYIGDENTHVVPDVSAVNGKTPVGTVALTDGTGDAFLESFNFQEKVAPIDYLYIYDQGGPDYADNNLTGLLTQAVRHGMVPTVVFYNIQAVTDAAGQSTGVVEGPDSAYKAINEKNLDWGQTPGLYTNFMSRYFTKVGKDFTTMNQVGVPVQIVMEPDFLGYMAINTPVFQQSFVNRAAFPVAGIPGYYYVASDTGKMYQWDGKAYSLDTTTPKPVNTDRTQNYANVMKPMVDAGLLSASGPRFDNTIEGMVKAINYYVGTMPNLRIGWKTNIWAVSPNDFQNGKMGVLHETDSGIYPWQNKWSSGVGWEAGKSKITTAGTNLGNFLNEVGVTSWSGLPERKPFLAIDKYGVDGAYPFDPNWQTSGTAALGDMTDLIATAQYWCKTGGSDACTDDNIKKYFGVDVATLKTLQTDRRAAGFPDAQFQQVFATFQNAAKADPNIARWFFNADQWNNYLRLVSALSKSVNAPVMLWQIPQGHINGSLDGRDLPDTSAVGCAPDALCGFQDSATSYFFGDSFTATGGTFNHMSADLAGDPKVTTSGSTITWGEHMSDAANAGVMSVLFGAGLGPSTRGTPTAGGGGITDQGFWADKAEGYLAVP